MNELEVQINGRLGGDISFEVTSVEDANALIAAEYRATSGFGCVGDQVDLPGGGYAELVRS